MCLEVRGLLPPSGWYDMNFRFNDDAENMERDVVDRGLQWYFDDRDEGRRMYQDVVDALPELLHVPFVKLPASKLLVLFGCIVQCVDYSCLSSVARSIIMRLWDDSVAELKERGLPEDFLFDLEDSRLNSIQS
jgi:hypothetical protein